MSSTDAILVTPGQKDSFRQGTVPVIDEIGPGELLLEVVAVGICGTDAEICEGLYGQAPAGHEALVLGHESLCRVVQAGSDATGFKPGDLVVPIVRRPCPERCPACAVGRWDECLTGHYQEHGIKGLDGFLRGRLVLDADAVVSAPAALGEFAVLTEPLTIVEKALERALQIHTAPGHPQTALVTGAGPVGILAALLLRSRGLDVYVVDQRPADSPKARFVESMGGHYIDDTKTPFEKAGPAGGFDIGLEATGYAPLVFRALSALAQNGVLALTGVTGGHHSLDIDVNLMNSTMVLENQAMVGSVNAARAHYERAVQDLAGFGVQFPGLLEQVITARHPLADFAKALQKGPDDIKTIVTLG
jgi:threonine dehydrogenase-like Zn-dependent dehydrogenase